MSGLLARLASVLAWALVVMSCAILGALGFGRALGYNALTVVSGSMEPRIHVGDVVVNETVAPLRARVGDVVSFRDPRRQSKLVTHRVRRIRVDGERVFFVTKGDANSGTERWNVDLDGGIGIVRWRLWKVGYALAWMRSPAGRLLFLVLPLLFVGGKLIVRIWSPPDASGSGHVFEPR